MIDYKIPVALGDQIYNLVPSLQAMEQIDVRFGGLLPAMQAIQEQSFNAFVDVIVLGAGLDPGQTRGEVAEQVFSAGMSVATQPVTDFLSALMRGGRPPDEEGALKGKKAKPSPK